MKTVLEILKEKGKVKSDVIAVRRLDVPGEEGLIDLHTLVDESLSLEPVTRDSELGWYVIRHSTAHVMADAVQRLFPGTKVTFGPSTEHGFFYDFDRRDGPFTDEDLLKIEAVMKEIIKKRSPFRREQIAREDAVALFEKMGESYKVEWMQTLPENTAFTLYRHGALGEEWVDFCKGPHVPNTGDLAAVKLMSVSGAYWRGDERNAQLQRIHGTAFHSQAALDAYLKQLEEAKARDHRKLGKDLELFTFDAMATASPFFLPRGAKVYNRLVEYVRDLYVRHDYEEVITPQIYSNELYLKSGHLANYRENMYLALTCEDFEQDKNMEAITRVMRADTTSDEELATLATATRGVKPMNCPGHAQLFSHRKRSYRELPWRCADFGRLHRFERGGVVHGLARVRTFCQDDAHIFCMQSQMQDEIRAFNKLLEEVYRAFGFTDVRVKLATRPEKRVGSDAIWDDAEHALEEALKSEQRAYTIAEGEGAFYGPKLEFHVKDAIGRSWQLGTIQVDFSMPARFDLRYVDEHGKDQTPVMLHRAVLGSLERFFAVYLEHVAGHFPVWLAPEQVALLTVSEKADEYARRALQMLKDKGIRAIADFSADKLGAKIRGARNMRIPYLAVIGQEEAESQTLALRAGNNNLGKLSVDELIAKLSCEGAWPHLQSPK